MSKCHGCGIELQNFDNKLLGYTKNLDSDLCERCFRIKHYNDYQKVIKDNNYNYGVKVQLSRENFPEKSYGNIVLPQGNYEAFRIIIGSGQGRNWWCVMFPPLCFVDESKAEVEYDKVEERINSENKVDTVSEDENKESDEDKSDSDDNIQIKFKFVEIFKNLFK